MKVQTLKHQTITSALRKVGFSFAFCGKNKEEHKSGFTVRQFSKFVVAVEWVDFANVEADWMKMNEQATAVLTALGYTVESPEKWADSLIAVTKRN